MAKGPYEARRHDCRRDRRQYRHRPCAGRACMGFKTVIVIPNPEPGKKRTCCGWRARNWCRCLPHPTATPKLCPLFRAGCCGTGKRRCPTAPSGPTSSTMSRNGRPMSKPGARDLGPDRRQGGWLHLRRGFGRHSGGRRDGPAAQGREDRPCRPGRGALHSSTPTARWRCRAPRSPEGIGQSGSPPTLRGSGPTTANIASRTMRRCPSSLTC